VAVEGSTPMTLYKSFLELPESRRAQEKLKAIEAGQLVMDTIHDKEGF
jgi:hypothetical protein